MNRLWQRFKGASKFCWIVALGGVFTSWFFSFDFPATYLDYTMHSGCYHIIDTFCSNNNILRNLVSLCEGRCVVSRILSFWRRKLSQRNRNGQNMVVFESNWNTLHIYFVEIHHIFFSLWFYAVCNLVERLVTWSAGWGVPYVTWWKVLCNLVAGALKP